LFFFLSLWGDLGTVVFVWATLGAYRGRGNVLRHVGGGGAFRDSGCVMRHAWGI